MGFLGGGYDEDPFYIGYNAGCDSAQKAAKDMGYNLGWNEAIDACIKVLLKDEEDTSDWKKILKLKKSR